MNANNENAGLMVPYVVYEAEQARGERREKRLWIALITAILAVFLSNAGWLIYESQFNTAAYEYSQDGEGINNINYSEQGNIVYGTEDENQSSEEKER